MHTSFADQLAGLDLAGFSIGPAPVSTSDFPVREAVVQTLEAVWSDLFAMMSGTALEADAEDLGWAFVNIFHRSAERKSTSVDRATDEVRALIATADGSEVHTHELETQVERAQCAEGAMLALEEMRERSEEHTSELQSLMRISYAVFCLKNKQNISDSQ